MNETGTSSTGNVFIDIITYFVQSAGRMVSELSNNGGKWLGVDPSLVLIIILVIFVIVIKYKLNTIWFWGLILLTLFLFSTGVIPISSMLGVGP